jgi:deoxyribodipyrimidine photo-lyase
MNNPMLLSPFNQKRVRELNHQNISNNGDYVLYWMQINRRFEYNFALQYAVKLANSLQKPLLIYEGLSASYPWASDRFHVYLMQGMEENLQIAEKNGWNYFGYWEPKPKAGNGLIKQLASKACALVTDDNPVFIMRTHNDRVSQKLSIPYIVVDSNGLIPFGITEKAPYTAFLFRKIMQKNFVEAIKNAPEQHPMQTLQNRGRVHLEDDFLKKYPSFWLLNTTKESFISSLPIDHSVKPIEEIGTREEALKKFSRFLDHKLKHYMEDRNHPDKLGASSMSGYLHFGKISEFEMVLRALEKQPESWSLDAITYKNGQSGDFYGGHPSIESFLDELITWREVGHHFAHHVANYDEFESLPDWALQTLQEHENDSREALYSLEEFEKAKTHDPIWNAAQRELIREGRIHNYLRMLWGKKILEWTPNPRKALEIMIELNNKYAIDGRDPNSYSGIFWVLGRFDRAWGERPVFGKIRYMSSDSTIKKIDMKGYLKRNEK